MKKVIPVLLLLGLSLSMCTSEAPKVQLQKGSEAYTLADTLSSTLPYLNPDENNVLVKSSEFRISTGELMQAMRNNFGNRVEQLKTMGADQLEEIIESNVTQLGEKKLLLDAAKEANVSAAPAKVDSALQAQFARVGGEEQFKQRLDQVGISMDAVRKDFTDGLTINKFLDQELRDALEVTEEDIQNEYNSDKTATVRHILFDTRGLTEAEKAATKDTAQMVLERAKHGEDFAELANKFSDDPGSNTKGGLYSDFGKGEMVPPFEDASFSIPEGEIGDELVETQFGYHIIKVIDRKKETAPLDSVRVQIERQLQQEKQQTAYEEYMTDLKDRTDFTVVEY